MKTTLAEIKTAVETLAVTINASTDLLPTYGQSIDGAHPHIEINHKNELHYVIVERGEEIKREPAANLDQLLYYIFADVTFFMAVKFEGGNRRPNEDSRRQLFAKQEELLGTLNEDWKQKEQERHQQILSKYPYDDQASIRATYSKQLRDGGMSAPDAWKTACIKYPEPLPK